MIQIFDIQEQRVVPAPACYMVPELADIVTVFPDEYLKVYQYIFGMTCTDSTNWYRNLPELEREDVLIADISPFEFSIEDSIIQKAIEKCNQLYETPTLRLAKAAKKKIDDIAMFLATTEIETGKDGNAMDIDRFMKAMLDYQKLYKALEGEVEKEQSKARGAIRRAYDQSPGYRNLKENE